nr:PREDICTED: uncharacterized protein LOC109042039 isoform X1 [Bemisia tabaci]
MSKNSGNVLLRPSLKLFRLFLCVYFIPQTFGFLGKIDDESGLHTIPRLRPLAAEPDTVAEPATKSEDEVTLKADAFIKSLETFNASKQSLKSSAGDLASSTKALLEAAGTTTEEDYYTTLLKHVNQRPEKFPEAQYHVHGGGTGERVNATIDLLVHRVDGEFFAFNAHLSWGHEIAYAQLCYLAQRNGTELFYRGFSRPVTRTIVVGVEFTGLEAMKFSYYVNPKSFRSPLTVIEL